MAAVPDSPADGEYLFVYGTLRANCGGTMHRLLAGHASRVGDGWIAGRLFDTGRYPAAVLSPDPDEQVHGELYRLEPEHAAELLAALDEYEGFSADAPDASLFRRERAAVLREQGEPICAWVYVYALPVDGLRAVPSGDYSAWITTQ